MTTETTQQEIILLPELPPVPSRTEDEQATYNTKAFNFRAAERELQQKFNINVPLLNTVLKSSTDILPNMDAIENVAGNMVNITAVAAHSSDITTVAVNSDHDVAVSGLAVVKAPRQECSHSLFLLDKLDVDVAVFTECAVRSRRAHKLFRTAPRRRIGYADAGVRRRVLRVPVKGCRHRRKRRHHALDGLLKLLHLCRIARWR